MSLIHVHTVLIFINYVNEFLKKKFGFSKNPTQKFLSELYKFIIVELKKFN